MILSNSKISARQLNRLILTAGTGTLMMLLPDAAGSGEAGIASLFVAFGVTLVHLKIVFWLVEKSGVQTKRYDSEPEKISDTEKESASDNQNRKNRRKDLAKRKDRENMFENGSISVRIILSLAAIIEFVKCLALSAGLLLAAANTVRTILLPGKSFALVAAVWLAGTVYLACAGTEARGRFGEAVWLIAVFPLVVLLLLCLAHIGKHGSITEEALISGEILKNNAVGILLRGILYSAVFAPVELIYWCRDKIAWDVTPNRLSKNYDTAADSQPRNLSETDAANRESGERKREVIYRKTERSIITAICIVFVFAILFTAAAVGILGIWGIQATEHSAMAIAAGLDVMGAVVAQKQGIAVLFFLTGMITSSGVLLGQMANFAEKAVGMLADRKRHVVSGENVGTGKGGGNGKRNHVISLCLAFLIWCLAAGFYGRFLNSTDGEQTAENTGTAGIGNAAESNDIAENRSTSENTEFAGNSENTERNGTATASLNTTAQIEDRAYCTAIGIDLAEEIEDIQTCDVTDENAAGQNQNTEGEGETEKSNMTEDDRVEDIDSEESDSEGSNRLVWNAEGKSAYIFTLEIAQGSDMEASLVTCKADSLAEAAAIFNANSDRELDVSHLQILLLGNSLLENGCYKTILLEFGDAAEYYFGGTLLAFTSETALEYMENYADSYDSEGTAVGIHLKKRFEQGLESEKAVLGIVYYRWLNYAVEEPSEWIPTLS
ncbi:MAG: hypothetical protein LUE29_11835 [Lachnospiraceae bacterium]|nr:hypothetical protein [Lachnospiraceae bacterium]